MHYIAERSPRKTHTPSDISYAINNVMRLSPGTTVVGGSLHVKVHCNDIYKQMNKHSKNFCKTFRTVIE